MKLNLAAMDNQNDDVVSDWIPTNKSGFESF